MSTDAFSVGRSSVGRPSNSLHFIVGEMSGKLDQVLSTLLADRSRVDHIEGRLTKVERWQWKVAGGGAIFVFLISVAEALYVNHK